MKTLHLLILLVSFAPNLWAQEGTTIGDEEFMTAMVNDGLAAKPEGFFNLGKTYDYTDIVASAEIVFPEDPQFSNKGGSVCTFHITLNYEQDGEKKSKDYRIMGRKGSSGNLEFYGSYLR